MSLWHRNPLYLFPSPAINPWELKKLKTQSHTKHIHSFHAIALLLLACLLMFGIVIFVQAWTKEASLPSNIGTSYEADDLEFLQKSNSSLISYAHLSPNADFPRTQKIETITIHHMAGNLSLEKVGELFSKRDYNASSNYAIDSQGNIGLFVEEANRAWSSSNRENDNKAITIEVADDDEANGQWHVSRDAFDALVDLCVDICRRNNIDKLIYTGDAQGNVTLHSMFSDTTDCPGPYLTSQIPQLVNRVNVQLAAE